MGGLRVVSPPDSHICSIVCIIELGSNEGVLVFVTNLETPRNICQCAEFGLSEFAT